MNPRRLLAIWSGKIIGFACKLAGKQGVTLAGKAALKIYPNILKELANEVRESIFVVCGTNGKTTTNNLLYLAIKSENKKVICNHTGSNMLNGVAAAFVLSARLNGKIDADDACIEVDEASTVHVFKYVRPQYMILTNLFRDQLDRYGEIDITMNILKDAIKMVPDMKIIVNGDDALSTFLAMESGNEYLSYGIKEQYFEEEDSKEIREGRFCKKCGEKLTYYFYHYSQLGDYECSSCGFKRPKLDYCAENIEEGGQLSFDVNKKRIDTNYRGFYNIYNIMAAYAAGRTDGLSLNRYNEVLTSYNPQNGRNEQFHIHNTQIILNLAKNPAGFNQNISSVLDDQEMKDLIILINDNAQDGTDISWLWDVNFDKFKGQNINTITVSGKRCFDMRLRLKYVDIEADLEPDIEKAIRDCIDKGSKNLYVLVNYTGLYHTHNILKKIEREFK